MAAAAEKRVYKHEDSNFSIPIKTFKSDNTNDEQLSAFLSWCASERLSVSRKVIKLSYMRGGVVIEVGGCCFQCVFTELNSIFYL